MKKNPILTSYLSTPIPPISPHNIISGNYPISVPTFFPMDFLSNLAKGDQPKSTSDQPNNPDHQDKKRSNSDLLASAKVVADAAQAQFRNESEKYDKAKTAAAAADLLDAASEYSKLDETKGVGKYVDQAEDYLRKYNSSQPAADSSHDKLPAADSSHEKLPAADSSHDKLPATDSSHDKLPAADAEKPSGGGGGAGDYIKMAEGFFNKPSEGAQSGGAGDYIKKAEGFLNKPSGDDGEKSEAPSQSSEGGFGDFTKMAGGFFKK